MPARRLLVRKIREVLRLKHERGLSHRAIAQACAIGVGTVLLYLQRTAQRGLGWPLPAELDDAVLEARLFRRAAPPHDRVRPDCAYIPITGASVNFATRGAERVVRDVRERRWRRAESDKRSSSASAAAPLPAARPPRPAARARKRRKRHRRLYRNLVNAPPRAVRGGAWLAAGVRPAPFAPTRETGARGFSRLPRTRRCRAGRATYGCRRRQSAAQPQASWPASVQPMRR